MSTTAGVPPGYHRVRRGRMAADNFTQICNKLFRDSRLSAKAMGVFGHISTHRDGYGVTPESISQHMRDGVSAIKGALRELEDCGYLVRSRERLADGTLGGTVYEITDEPEENPSSEPADGNRPQVPTRGNVDPTSDPDEPDSRRSEPADGNPPVDNPPVENHPPKNINFQNTRTTRTNQAPVIGDADGREHRDDGWLDKPPSTEPPARPSAGIRFLMRLPVGCRPDLHAINRLAPLVEALFAGKWTWDDLMRQLTGGIDSATNPPGAVIRRIERLEQELRADKLSRAEVAEQRQRAAEERADDARQRAETRALAIANCFLCDEDGYDGNRLCDHNPDQADVNAAGSARAKAALAELLAAKRQA